MFVEDGLQAHRLLQPARAGSRLIEIEQTRDHKRIVVEIRVVSGLTVLEAAEEPAALP